MKKQFLFFLFCLCAGVSNLWAQETDWSPLFTRVSEGITYTCENDEAYPWNLANGSLISTNKAHSSSSTFKITFSCESAIYFHMQYGTSSEGTYDKLTVVLDERTFTCSGTVSSFDFVELQPGEHVLTLTYSKDGSGSSGSDQVWVSSLKLTDMETGIPVIGLAAPGQLGEEAIAQFGTLPKVDVLRLKGSLNKEDWTTIKNMTYLCYLDMSETTVTEIPAEAFTNTSIRTIKWPANLKVIGGKAFYNKYLRGHLVLPETLDSIGPSAFYRNYIDSVSMPHKQIAFANDIFRENSNLTKVEFNSCASYMTNNMFYSCKKLRSVSGMECVKTIGGSVFAGCDSLRTVGNIVPTMIGNNAFYACRKLESFDLSQVTSVGEGAFQSCHTFKSVHMPNVTSLGDLCFYDCAGLTEVSVGDKISKIPNQAFSSCPSLKTVTLGASVSDIGYYAFRNSSVEKLYVNSPTPPGVYNNDVFGSTSGTLYVPEYSMVSYKLHDYWSKFTSVDVNPNPVTSLTLSGKLSLTSNARIPDSPNVMMNTGSSFIVNGNKEQTLGSFVAYYNNGVSSSVISRCNNMTSTGSEARYWMNSGYWYFICPPFDVRMSDITTISGNQVAIRYYDSEARAAGSTSNWKDVAPEATLKAGQGYIFRVSSADYVCMPATEETHNQIFRSQAVTTPLSEYSSDDANARNWNLVGNPYACFYDIYRMDYTAPLTVWNSDNRTYNAYSIADDDFALRPMEAFFVQKPDGVEAITFQPEGRQTDSNIDHSAGVKAMAGKAASRRFIELELSNGTTDDHTRLVVNPQAQETFDANNDASKMMSTDITAQIFSVLGDEAYAIKESPFAAGQAEIGMWFPADGQYVVNITRADVKVELMDNGAVVPMPYTFTADEGFCEGRFVLRITTDPTAIEGVDGNDASAPLYDLQGRKVGSTTHKGIYVQKGKKMVVK
ncbi:MAG: leucine-rich repeat domain-containing protein [Bacteroidaceae bacterium]|nr:leucine-rich repeat domain-containing protein [Paraprevotella sp.]MDY2716675.1 leucine-rich repeat domain-containing protein [Bacteroidaceae bacterium]